MSDKTVACFLVQGLLSFWGMGLDFLCQTGGLPLHVCTVITNCSLHVVHLDILSADKLLSNLASILVGEILGWGSDNHYWIIIIREGLDFHSVNRGRGDCC